MHFWRSSSSSRFADTSSIVELLVQIDCKGCEDRVRKALSQLDGVRTIDINMDTQKVTVTGSYLEKRQVLKAVRRSVRKAEFWPSPYDDKYHPFALEYLDQQTFEHTYNYYVHGYNGSSSQGCLTEMSHSMDDSRFYMFSEENVNACNVM
nr:heavy metal-associated isoprenylated plant protein 45 [Sedum plumbizincicola]